MKESKARKMLTYRTARRTMWRSMPRPRMSWEQFNSMFVKYGHNIARSK